MISIARVLALAGLILLGAGAVLPTNRAQGFDDVDCSTQIQREALIAVDCLSEDVSDGYAASGFGFMLVVVAAGGFIAALTPTPGRLWTLAMTATCLVAMLFLYQDSARNLNASGDLDWGWGVLLGSVVLLVIASLIATISPIDAQVAEG